MEPALRPIQTIVRDIEQLAASALRANYWIGSDVRAIEASPLGRQSKLIAQLYPAAEELTLKPIKPARARSRLARHLSQQESTNQTSGLADGFLAGLASPGAEWFEILGKPGDHPFDEFTYWTYWLLAIDRVAGRCMGLALGASD